MTRPGIPQVAKDALHQLAPLTEQQNNLNYSENFNIK
jgi:hypothetical protein